MRFSFVTGLGKKKHSTLFNKKLYKQIDGVTMANIVMCSFESKRRKDWPI